MSKPLKLKLKHFSVLKKLIVVYICTKHSKDDSFRSNIMKFKTSDMSLLNMAG